MRCSKLQARKQGADNVISIDCTPDSAEFPTATTRRELRPSKSGGGDHDVAHSSKSKRITRSELQCDEAGGDASARSSCLELQFLHEGVHLTWCLIADTCRSDDVVLLTVL